METTGRTKSEDMYRKERERILVNMLEIPNFKTDTFVSLNSESVCVSVCVCMSASLCVCTVCLRLCVSVCVCLRLCVG